MSWKQNKWEVSCRFTFIHAEKVERCSWRKWNPSGEIIPTRLSLHPDTRSHPSIFFYPRGSQCTLRLFIFLAICCSGEKGGGCKASHSSVTKYHNQEDKEITHYRFQKEIMDYLFVFMLICANRRCSQSRDCCFPLLLFF